VPAIQNLTSGEAVTASELHGRFVAGGGFELEFGQLEAFFGGLEAVVGSPAPKVKDGMEAEHCSRDDSEVEFTVDNYGIVTTSKTEWVFVADPEGGQLGDTWPAERGDKLPDGALPRKPLPLASFAGAVEARNAQLRAQSQPEASEVDSTDIPRGMRPAL